MISSLLQDARDTLNAVGSSVGNAPGALAGPGPVAAVRLSGGDGPLGLVQALEAVPDSRSPLGIRCALSSLLAVAVCAMSSGAVTFASVGDLLDDLPEDALAVFGLRRRADTFTMTPAMFGKPQ